jgi:hypothetical protein
LQKNFFCKLTSNFKKLIAAMAYVDLNPIRARTANNLRGSKHTSIRKRAIATEGDLKQANAPLKPLLGSMSFHTPLITQKDYIKLVDCTGRIVAPGKKSKISADTPKALDALGLNPRCLSTYMPAGSNYKGIFTPMLKVRALKLSREN